MVLNSESNNPRPPINHTPTTNSTTPTNPPPPSSLSRTMATSAPFYPNPLTFNHNLTTPNTFGWTGNRPSIFPNYVGMNPIPHVGSSSNQFENLTRPILHLGLGPYPSLLETHLNRNTFFRFGSETNQTQNAINSLLQLGLNSNREQTNNNSFLQLGSSSIPRVENKNSLVMGHGSSLNRDENRDISNLNRFENIGINPNSNYVEKNEFRGFEFHALGLDPVVPVSEADKNEISLVLGLGSSPNMVENKGTNPGSNKVEDKGIDHGCNKFEKEEISDFMFRALVLDPVKPVSEGKKNGISLVPCLSSSPNQVENRGIKSDSIQVETNFEFCSLPLDPVESISENLVYKNQNQLDLIQKGKSKVSVGSPVKAKGSDKNNDAEESDREEEDEVGAKCSYEESNTPLVKTWNLRPRKPRVNPEKQGNNGSGRGGGSRKSATPTRASNPRYAANIRPQSKVERPVMEKPELVISLTKEEIEHDFILMTGEKPPKKLNKRSRAVQKNLDDVFPGMHLTNITPERYNVHNNAHL